MDETCAGKIQDRYVWIIHYLLWQYECKKYFQESCTSCKSQAYRVKVSFLKGKSSGEAGKYWVCEK